MPKQLSLKERLEDPLLEQVVTVVMAFAQQLSGKEYYPYQYIIGSTIVRHVVCQSLQDITVLLSRQSGKSTITYEVTSSMLTVLPELAKVYGDTLKFWNEEDQIWDYPLKRFAPNFKGSGTGGVRIGVYAPKEQQAQVIFSGVKTTLEGERGREILKEMGLTVTASRGDTFSISNNSRIICETANETANIESATHDVILLDEAQDITTQVIAKSIEPMKANTGGNMVYVGTCGTQVEDFYKTIQLNKNLQIEDQVQRHFEFDYRYCSASNPWYRKEVKRQIDKRGYESDFVKMNYRLMWMLERGQFCTEDMLYGKGAWTGKGIFDYELNFQDEERFARCYAGVDLGKESDSTVVTILRVDDKNPIRTRDGVYYKKEIINWLEIYGDNYESQYWEIVEFLRRFNIDKLCIDATSQGDPFADRLMTYVTSIYVEPIKFSEKQNSEMFKLVAQEIQAGRLRAPYGPAARHSHEVKTFTHQMLELEKEYRNQYLKVKHPAIRGAHDDYFSSLALAVWATADATLPEIEEVDNTIFQKIPRTRDAMPNIIMGR